MFSSLKVRNFRIYWFGMLLSLIGTWIQSIAQSWLVFHLTNSAFLLGVVGFLGTVPVFFLSIYGGILADRMDKKLILFITQSVFMVLAFLLAVLTQFNIVTPLEIMIIALLNGVVIAFDAPTRQAVVVDLVGKKHLFNAIVLNSVAFNSSQVIGPAIAGILIAFIGLSGCFYVNGVSFLAMLIALSLIKLTFVPKKSGTSAFRDFKDGIKFIQSNSVIMMLLSMVGMVSLFGVSYVILMPVFASAVFKTGARGLGILMSAVGFGSLIGALFLARLGDFKNKGKMLASVLFIFSFSLIIFSFSRSLFFAGSVLLFVGGCGVVAVSLVNTLIQTKVGDEFRGRVMGVFMLTFAGIMPFGNLIAGIMASRFGAPLTLRISGLICGAFFIAINLAYPQIRRIE